MFSDDRVTGVPGRDHVGRAVTEHAEVVVGADGLHSLVARAVRPDQYHDKPRLQSSYHTYFSGLPTDGRYEVHLHPERGRGFGVIPTNDDLTLVIGGWPYAEFEASRRDVEGNYLRIFDLVPPFAERIRAARRETALVGAAVPSYFRKPFGPGWALVGDAGHNRDFITAQGITDAFRDAELCAAALHERFRGECSFEVAMARYQSGRDQHVLSMYEFTAELALLQPSPLELAQLLAAVHGNPEAMDAFARVNAGMLSPAEFFSDQNVGRILGAATRSVPDAGSFEEA